MPNNFDAKILKDSVSPNGYRLTTMEVTFPRFVLAEFNTHRVFSRNSASSRAIPINKQIERVRKHPFVPLGFGSAKAGMSAGDDLTGRKAKIARQAWLNSRWSAIGAAMALEKTGVHKSFANRLLEPWLWHTVIVTSSYWSNFFGLRTHEAAQPEIRLIAQMMLLKFQESVPEPLKPGEWHLPLVNESDREKIFDPERRESEQELVLLSAGRCARVSFDRHHDSEPIQKSLARAEMLTSNGHWSPIEHQARVAYSVDDANGLRGNFAGDWIQARKLFPNENDFTESQGIVL